MIHTFFRKNAAFTLILTLIAGATLIALCSFACPIADWTYMDSDGNIMGGYFQDCDNTEKSVSVYASVWKGTTFKYWVIPHLYVSSSSSFTSRDMANNSGIAYLEAYVEGDPDPRHVSYSFNGPKSKSHYAYNDWAFVSSSANPGNKAHAEISHDNHSDVETDSLSI